MANKEKTWKGGQVLTYGLDFITYLFEIMSNVTEHTARYTYENLFSIVYHIMFLVSYVLCFYYLQFKNTEIPCMVMLTVLHCVFLFMVLIVKIKLPLIEKGNVWSFGSFSMYIISFGWIFIFIALSFLLKVYYDLYYKFIPNGVDIDFGSSEALRQQLMKYLAYSSVFMWIFYVLEYLKTNNVLLLNFLFILLALFLLVIAIYSFIQRWFVWGTLMTIVSFISMSIVKKINDARINYVFFFARNQMANNAVLLFGIIFNIMAVYVYYLSSQLVEYTKSIDIPDILKMNPVYHEGFVINEIVNGMDCTFNTQDHALYNLLKSVKPQVLPDIYARYCRPTSSATPIPPTPRAPNVMRDKLLNMVGDSKLMSIIGGGGGDGGNSEDDNKKNMKELMNSVSEYMPQPEPSPVTPTPTSTTTPTPTTTLTPTPTPTIKPT